MTPSLCIFSCHNFHPEAAACVRLEGWTDVVTAEFPSRCGRPPMTWDELRAYLPPGCTKVIIFGRACIGALGQAPDSFPPVQVIVKEQCFHLIAGQTLVDAAIADGAYLMSPAWVRHWRTHIAEQGFTPDSAGEFYRDFANKLVLLDTGADADAAQFADEFSQVIDLPLHRIAVGLDPMRLMLVQAVLGWRLEQLQADTQQSQRAHSAELADHVAALDLLGRLTELRQETDVLAAIEDLFHMLFAPRDLYFQMGDHSHHPADVALPPALQGLSLSVSKPYAWTPDEQGFALLLTHDGQELGRIVVDGLTFPQYRERYLNMALSMTGVCALALDSARTRKRLVEMEKMASLGVVVAGVAHEINTPIGVGILAASTLQRETQKLTQSFAERSMTQTSLQAYFGGTQTQVGLILSNLERVGKLVDTFRQVAVNGLPQTKSPIRLARCIRDVITSMGESLNNEKITLHVDCDDAVEIKSYAGDWISIFTNLMTNSLQHGFRNRDHGHIDITVRQISSRLLITYADDGIGLAPEVREHVFDPFFTTDLQSGMGLGMHLVYNMVTQRMGGNITCDAPVESGALFHIEVPVQNERASA
jgi:signal transduction histidine kinase